MPVAESEKVQDSVQERDRELGQEKEKNAKGKGASGSSKGAALWLRHNRPLLRQIIPAAKDLSHVPCKFFKVGSCTAGSSCPFSHSITEPGQSKDICAWYVKGNCKFGHKCALAHVLPGQSMAMDRKNKKAAQLAAGGGGGGKGGRGQKKDAQNQNGTSAGPSRNPLLSGSTAPTRVLQASTRPPISMALKATISPSAPAPPLTDTDFTAFDLPEESSQLYPAPAQSNPAAESSTPPPEPIKSETPSKLSPSPLPRSTPRRLAHNATSSIDFGPIGSPPRSSLNGFSPGVSPSHNAGFASTSPFSAPGTHSAFLKDSSGSSDFKARSGLAASLGAARNWNPIPRQVSDANPKGSSSMLGGEIVVEDEDLEEFLPSSLTDLLTPEERSRRMSRANSGQGAGNIGIVRDSSASGQRTSSHHYSRSVPAPSLMGDIRSIWSDSGKGLPGSPDAGIAGINVLGAGTSSSFKSSSNVNFGGRSLSGEGDTGHGLSSSLLSPSNASAAFLPGLHHHYLNSKSSTRTGSSSLFPPGQNTPSSLSSNAFLQNTNSGNDSLGGSTLSPPRLSTFSGRPPFDVNLDFTPASVLPSNRARPAEPHPNTNNHNNALSPSFLALQSHAPGQSLPQGLAAGYSRIHALPPPPSIPSPAGGGFSPGQVVGGGGFSPGQIGGHSPGTNGDWSGRIGGSGTEFSSPPKGTNYEGLLSRLSYSTTTARPMAPSSSQPIQPQASRNPSSGRWQHGGPLSPLSGPVVTGDIDDDLFSMDG
jgi:hypothetical protein